MPRNRSEKVVAPEPEAPYSVFHSGFIPDEALDARSLHWRLSAFRRRIEVQKQRIAERDKVIKQLSETVQFEMEKNTEAFDRHTRFQYRAMVSAFVVAVISALTGFGIGLLTW